MGIGYRALNLPPVVRSRRANGTRYQVLQKYKETRNIEKRPSSCWLTNMMAAVKAFVERQMRGEKEQQQWGAPSRGAALGRAQTPWYQTHPYFIVIRASCWHSTPYKHSIQSSIAQDSSIVYWVPNHSWSFIQQGIISESLQKFSSILSTLGSVPYNSKGRFIFAIVS